MELQRCLVRNVKTFSSYLFFFILIANILQVPSQTTQTPTITSPVLERTVRVFLKEAGIFCLVLCLFWTGVNWQIYFSYPLRHHQVWGSCCLAEEIQWTWVPVFHFLAEHTSWGPGFKSSGRGHGGHLWQRLESSSGAHVYLGAQASLRRGRARLSVPSLTFIGQSTFLNDRAISPKEK